MIFLIQIKPVKPRSSAASHRQQDKRERETAAERKGGGRVGGVWWWWWEGGSVVSLSFHQIADERCGVRDAESSRLNRIPVFRVF